MDSVSKIIKTCKHFVVNTENIDTNLTISIWDLYPIMELYKQSTNRYYSM